MNQVLETERRAEADLIEARKEAEILKIRSIAENEAQLRKVQAEKEQIQARTEAESLQLENRLKAEIKEAKALQEHPELLKLKQIQALREISNKDSKFIVGLDTLGYDKALNISSEK